MSYKSGFVSIIGRTNVGKSTLLNSIIGEKVAITSNRPQTTRNTIKGIVTEKDFQIVFIDTPGIHKPKNRLGQYMIKSANSSIIGVDAVLFIIEADEKEIANGDKLILEQLKDIDVPVILVINKIDELNNKEQLLKVITNFSSAFDFFAVVPISAISGEGKDELITEIKKVLPEGPQYFPEDIYTDQAEKIIIAEIIREKALELLQDEVPHGIAVDVGSLQTRKNGDVYISADIYCERESHKPIIIGKNGQMLKTIGQNARIDIEEFLDKKVFLEIWVKVKKNWLDNENIIKGFFNDFE